MGKLAKSPLMIFLIGTIFWSLALISGEPYQGHIAEPVQTYLANGQTINILGETGYVELSLVAEYEVEGVVKGKKKYSDYPAQVSAYDLALAWGDLNKAEIDELISYSQSGRWYYYRYSPNNLVSKDYIANHSANMHLVYRDQAVLNEIKRIGKNDHVRLEGYLVNVNFKGSPWRTSLSRADTGNGACEIIYVTKVNIID
jgi:hypothetical protein